MFAAAGKVTPDWKQSYVSILTAAGPLFQARGKGFSYQQPWLSGSIQRQELHVIGDGVQHGDGRNRRAMQCPGVDDACVADSGVGGPVRVPVEHIIEPARLNRLPKARLVAVVDRQPLAIEADLHRPVGQGSPKACTSVRQSGTG